MKPEETHRTSLQQSITKGETSNGPPNESSASAITNFCKKDRVAAAPVFNLAVSSFPDATGSGESYGSFIDYHSWPNVGEERRLPVMKGSTNESFARKAQAWSPGKRTPKFLNFSEMLPADKCVRKNESFDIRPQKMVAEDDGKDISETLQNLGASDVKNFKSLTLLSKTSMKDNNNKKADKLTKGPPPECSQLEPMKPLVPPKGLPLLGEDFPDLPSASKFLSQCPVSHEFKRTEKEKKSHDTHHSHKVDSKRRKLKRKQPLRRDPISVNIIDIIKKADSCIQISPKNLQKIKNRDLERRTLGGNTLDSSNPVRKRGKHREVGPRKKLSRLKSIILSERSKKQEQREQCAMNFSSVPEEPLKKPSVDSVCNGIVSLKITGSASTSCCQLLNDDVNYNKRIGIDLTPKTLILEEVSIESRSPATSNDSNFPSLQNAITDKVQLVTILPTLHSRKFREYCDNIRSKELDEAVANLLKVIYGFQDRHYQKDPIRAHAKRRFVLGIREVKKYLMLKRLKFIVIAPDLEPVKSPGGLDQTVVHIREEGRTQQIPVIFAVGRRQLGFALMKKVPISIVGVISAEGAEELYREVLNQWHIAVERYQQKVSELCLSSENK